MSLLDNKFMQIVLSGSPYMQRRHQDQLERAREQERAGAYRGLLESHTTPGDVIGVDEQGGLLRGATVDPMFYKHLPSIPGFENIAGINASNAAAMQRQTQQQEWDQTRDPSVREQWQQAIQSDQFGQQQAVREQQLAIQQREAAQRQQMHEMQLREMERQQQLGGMPIAYSWDTPQWNDFTMEMDNRSQNIVNAEALISDIEDYGTKYGWGDRGPFGRGEGLGQARIADLRMAFTPIIEDRLGRPVTREEAEHIFAPLETAATWSNQRTADNAIQTLRGWAREYERKQAREYQAITGQQLPPASTRNFTPTVRSVVPELPSGFTQFDPDQPINLLGSQGHMQP